MMSANDATFGLFANDKASEVFKRLGLVAKTTSKDTQSMADMVEKASAKVVATNNKELSTTAKVQIQQQKLNEMRAKGNIATSSMMAQEEKLTVALRENDVATQASAVAVSELTSAEARAAFGADTMGKGFHGAGNGAVFAEGKFGKMVKTMATGAAVFAGYELFKFGKDSIKAASDFQSSQTKMNTAITNTGHNVKNFTKPIDDLNTRFRKLGYTDSQTQDAFATLTTALKSPVKAMALMGVTADLARFHTMGLSESALIVAKGAEGFIKPIKALGIDLPIASAGALKLANAHAALAKAQAHLHSLGGQSVTMTKHQVKLANAASDAQVHLTDMTNKYSDPAKRTIAQTNALAAAQKVVNLEQSHGVAGNNKYQKALEAVYLARENVNKAESAGAKITQELSDRVKNQAVNATKDLTVKQQALNAEMDHLKATLGEGLLPFLNKLADWGIRDGKQIVGVFAGIAAGFATAKIVTGIATLMTAFKEFRALLVTVDIAEALATGGASVIAAMAALGVAGAAYGITEMLLSGPSKPEKPKVDGQGGHWAYPKNASRNYSPQWIPDKPTATWVPLKPSTWVPLKPAFKPLTTSHSSSIPLVVIHVHGHVTTEKKLIEVVHNGIARNMKKVGVNPKVIGK